MTPRSGSTYLASLFERNSELKIGEHFRIVKGSLEQRIAKYNSKKYDEYIRNIITDFSRNRVFGVKLDWIQFAPVYYLGAYRHYFQDNRFVYLTRSNLVKQAISGHIAAESGYYHSFYDNEDAVLNVAYDFDKIDKHLNHLLEMMRAWESFFAYEGITPLRITYEAIQEKPAEVMRQLFRFCEMDDQSEIMTKTSVERVCSRLNEDFYMRFVKESEYKIDRIELN
ncbi:MAG: Stf0 family sulfotransferase [Verrucomicrobiota bacterium]